MLAQPSKRESMAQTVGGDVGAGQAGPPDQGGDGILNRAHRHGRAVTRPEHRGFGLRRRLLFEQLAQGAAGVAFNGTSRSLSPLPFRTRTVPARSRSTILLARATAASLRGLRSSKLRSHADENP
jgi:hypothetical protein